MKFLTEGEAETKRQKAVEFLRRIGNDDAADEFDDMTAAEYAEHRGVELLDNPHRRKRPMARTGKTKAELEAELDEANEYIEDLESKLDSIADMASGEDEEDADEGIDDEDDDQGEE